MPLVPGSMMSSRIRHRCRGGQPRRTYVQALDTTPQRARNIARGQSAATCPPPPRGRRVNQTITTIAAHSHADTRNRSVDASRYACPTIWRVIAAAACVDVAPSFCNCSLAI
ncbi:hypothetical protein WR25_23565 [Diploscapter pachys]|uniref:Uncharacterized protein n=1 Tax=Diploscapter pachys TaxID=2018661 RepID=A0A2A2M565_9BILA|nr:hypothetical protein WR25_23565 [Diploscapter pachys]